jgi:hypothetical protein
MVCVSFFLNRLVEQFHVRCLAQQLSPAPHSTIRRDLIVLHTLTRGDQRRVAHRIVGRILHHVFRFGHQRRHHLALHRFGLAGRLVQNLFEAGHVFVRLLQMRLKSLFQLCVRRLVDHLRQRLRNLLLGRQQHLQLVDVQLAKIVDVRGKDLHVFLLCPGGLGRPLKRPQHPLLL